MLLNNLQPNLFSKVIQTLDLTSSFFIWWHHMAFIIQIMNSKTPIFLKAHVANHFFKGPAFSDDFSMALVNFKHSHKMFPRNLNECNNLARLVLRGIGTWVSTRSGFNWSVVTSNKWLRPLSYH